MPGLKKDVYCYYKIDKYIATINGKQNIFEKKWYRFEKLFEKLEV